MEKRNLVVEKVVDFGIEIIEFCEILDSQWKWVVSKQLLRSGTSIGASVFESQHAESRADFIHKLKTAIKETSETLYWLYLCEKSKSYPVNSSLKTKAEELIRIISQIIISTKANQ